ncbi:MAG: GNAT family N-acetyltransferase [Candidatus Bathyarchaeota archaeon]|nr:MAG: GNAT family N-acetyltransferase [Candidatus Bathyarchaeota archaeon]
MAIEIKEVGAEALSQYAEIPTAFRVKSIFHVDAVDHGLGGFSLVEKKVDPYTKDYDRQGDGRDRPINWENTFDISQWGFFLAFDEGRPVGGAAVAFDTPEINLLENRRDLAVLWDIRVHPDRRRSGIGTRLLTYVVDWARSRGCTLLKIETQNVNIPGCRFYAKRGCELGAIHRYAYSASPAVSHETMLLWYLKL